MEKIKEVPLSFIHYISELINVVCIETTYQKSSILEKLLYFMKYEKHTKTMK